MFPMPAKPANQAAPKAPARRGRPAAAVYAPEDVAQLMGVPVAWVLRALDQAAPVFFPGAFRDGSQWQVPERVLRGLLGPGLPQLFTVADFAALIGFSVPWVYELIDIGVIECRTVFGHKRVPSTAYWSLPAARPAGVGVRPHFFSEDKTA